MRVQEEEEQDGVGMIKEKGEEDEAAPRMERIIAEDGEEDDDRKLAIMKRLLEEAAEEDVKREREKEVEEMPEAMETKSKIR